MNTEKLQRIRAKCVELLALAEKRTQGKWEASENYLIGGWWVQDKVAKEREGSIADFGREIDANFIAACAGPAEAGWRSTIAAIDNGLNIVACFDAARFEGLYDRLEEQQYETGTLRDLVERRISYAETEAIKQLELILSAWPDELL